MPTKLQPSINDYAVACLTSFHTFWRNPLAPHYLKADSDSNSKFLVNAPYPCRLPFSSPYDNLWTQLIASNVYKSHSTFTAASWLPDGRRCMAVTTTGEITLWNSQTFALEDVKRLPDCFGALTSCEWDVSGQVTAIGDHGGGVHLCSSSLSRLALLKDFQGHAVLDLSTSPSGYKLVGVAVESYPIIWDLRYQTQARLIEDLGYDVTFTHWHPSKSLIAFGSKSDRLGFIDPRSPTPVCIRMAHNGSLTALRFSTCGDYIATAGRDSQIRIWDLKTFQYAKQFRLPNNKLIVTQLCWDNFFSPKFLVAGDTDGNIIVYDFSLLPSDEKRSENYDPTLYRITKAHSLQISSLNFHPSGSVLTSTGLDGRINTWGKHNNVSRIHAD